MLYSEFLSLRYSTPQERKLIYEQVLSHTLELKKNIGIVRFICPQLEHVLTWKSIGLDDTTSYNIMKYFPEFYQQKPPRIRYVDGPWWDIDDFDSRIAALQRAIDLCK